MKHILLTLEVGSQDEQRLHASPSTEISSESSQAVEPTIVITGSISMAP